MQPSETFHQDATRFVIDTIGESYAGESRASDLRKEIKKKEQFINMASFENPMNMADDQAQLEDLRAELESLGGEELELTEGEGGHQDLDDTTQYTDDPEEKAEEDTSDYEVDVDEYLKTGEPVQKIPSDKRADEEEDVELVPDKGEFLNMMRDIQSPPEKAEEDDYVDDSDNAGEKYVCPDCDEEFNSDEQLQGHQYSYYHGKYKDEGEGEDMPRNEMGGY